MKKLQARRIRENYSGGYQLMKNVGHCGCLIKKYCQLKLSTMTRNTSNNRKGRFQYKLVFLRDHLRLTSVFKFLAN